jgi:hypothetical protein
MLHSLSFTVKAARRTMASGVTLFFIALCAENIWASECFDNKDLVALQAKSHAKRGTLVYVWSPRMVYSLQNMTLASRAAAAAGLDFLVLHDGRVPKDEMGQAMRFGSTHPTSARLDAPTGFDLATPPYNSLTASSRPLCASQLIEREAFRHFPTAFVVSAQGVHPQPIVGAMPWQGWVSSLDQRLNAHPFTRQARP